jgi:predicted Fe-Mo cluster-binding NifX family protein
MSQRICIPLESENGYDSVVCAHFGRAPAFAVLGEDFKIEEVFEKATACDEGSHGHCLPIDELTKRGVTTLICQSIGRGAMGKAIARGIEVIHCERSRLGEVVLDYAQGRCHPLLMKNICQGHSHEH